MAGSVVPSFIKHRSRGVVSTSCAITTDASGDASVTTAGVFFGRLVSVLYDGGLDASAVVTIKDATTGASICAFTTGTEGTPVKFRPTKGIVDVAGAVITAADTAPKTNRDIYLAGKVTLTVASGGNVETGTFVMVVDEHGIGDLAVSV